MRHVGAIFTPYSPPEALRAAAHAAEESGVPELWLWEDCFRESAFAAASAVLAWTTHLRVGIGVAPMPLRNVALTAMEIATLERLFPGRLIPGVGHGVLSWMGQVGARVASPLTLMREYVPALRVAPRRRGGQRRRTLRHARQGAAGLAARAGAGRRRRGRGSEDRAADR